MARSHACAASSVAVKAISCGSLTPGSSFFCSRSTCSRSASSHRCPAHTKAAGPASRNPCLGTGCGQSHPRCSRPAPHRSGRPLPRRRLFPPRCRGRHKTAGPGAPPSGCTSRPSAPAEIRPRRPNGRCRPSSVRRTKAAGGNGAPPAAACEIESSGCPLKRFCSAPPAFSPRCAARCR